jgi:hypothetical protein
MANSKSKSVGRVGGCFRGELPLRSLSASARLLLGRLDGVLWIPMGDVFTSDGSATPFWVGVGGNSGSSRSRTGKTPRGGERRRARPLNGSSSSSSCAAGAGNGRGEGLFIERLGLAPIPPIGRRIGLSDSAIGGPDMFAAAVSGSTGSEAGWFSDAPSSCAVSCWSSSFLPVLLGRESAGALACPCARWALRRSRMSGLARPRLALVGEAKEGRRRRADGLLLAPCPASSDEGASEALTGTLEVGDVLRRLGADVSISGRPCACSRLSSCSCRVIKYRDNLYECMTASTPGIQGVTQFQHQPVRRPTLFC